MLSLRTAAIALLSAVSGLITATALRIQHPAAPAERPDVSRIIIQIPQGASPPAASPQLTPAAASTMPTRNTRDTTSPTPSASPTTPSTPAPTASCPASLPSLTPDPPPPETPRPPPCDSCPTSTSRTPPAASPDAPSGAAPTDNASEFPQEHTTPIPEQRRQAKHLPDHTSPGRLREGTAVPVKGSRSSTPAPSSTP